MNLPTEPMHGPILGEPSTAGRPETSIPFNRCSDSREIAALAMSDTMAERSRIFPSTSSTPGFSAPLGPKRSSFIILPGSADYVFARQWLCWNGTPAYLQRGTSGLHCGLMSGHNTPKIRRTARKIWCEIDAILYLGRSHEMFLQVWDAFEKQRIVPEGDVVEDTQGLMNLPHVSPVGNHRQPEFARE